MPYPPQKSENYTNFGGVNEKASHYLLGVNEFLKISNFNFLKTGSLSKDYGITQYVPYGFTYNIGFTNFGISGIVPGFSQPPILGIFEYSKFPIPSSGVAATTAVFTPNNVIISTNQDAAYEIYGGLTLTVTNIYTYLNNNFALSYFDDSTFQNIFYSCNGQEFFKFDGISAFAYSLPSLFRYQAYADSFTEISSGSSALGLSGFINFAYALQNAYGLIGPAQFMSYMIGNNSTFSIVPGATALVTQIGTNGLTTPFVNFSFSPFSYGATAKIIWARQGTGDYLYMTTIPYAQTTYILTAAALSNAVMNFDGFTQPNFYIGAFNYQVAPSGFSASTNNNIGFFGGGGINPSYLDIFNNQLALAGIATQPSNVYLSDIGNPEVIQSDSFFEVRTNDGDVITGLKAYFNQLIIFKKYSFHSLAGTDFSNFQLTQLSSEYGAISNRAICQWEQKLWFLDQKGICEYNGANIGIISQKMEDTFKCMNQMAAPTNAIMVHVKDKNEVWCAIPTNGSFVNNTIVIYDYISDAWRLRQGVNCSDIALSNVDMLNTNFQGAYKTVYSDYSGIINYFGSTFYSDGSNGMTCVARSRYLNNLGNSVEKVFRRLYLDADVVSGVTQVIGINFYTNQSTMAAYSTTMMLSTYQSRIDFGLSARDLAVEFIYNQNNPLRINGFTIEYRFQRAV